MKQHKPTMSFSHQRRRVAAALAGAVSTTMMETARSTTVSASTSTPTANTALAFDVPAGACDCHTHVFPDPRRFPFWEGRTYTPPVATFGALLDLHDALNMQRVVIVQPSVYGTDNSATLAGIARLGLDRARGIAVVDRGTTRDTLTQLWESGIRGVRINLEAGGVTNPDEAAQSLDAAVSMIDGTGIHLQVFARLPLIAALHGRFAQVPVPVVFDHFSGIDASSGTEQPGFGEVLDLVRRGTAYVKVSAPYRVSKQAPHYQDVVPYAKALVSANPDRVLWGTDWPHPVAQLPARPTDIAAPFSIDNIAILNLLAHWVPQESVRQKILVDTPASLYGFSRPTRATA